MVLKRWFRNGLIIFVYFLIIYWMAVSIYQMSQGYFYNPISDIQSLIRPIHLSIPSLLGKVNNWLIITFSGVGSWFKVAFIQISSLIKNANYSENYFVSDINSWNKKITIQTSLYYYRWFKVNLDNGILNYWKTGNKIIIFSLIIIIDCSFIYNLTVLYIYGASIIDDDAIILFGIFAGIATLILTLVYSITLVQGGAWERQIPFFWNPQLLNTLVLILISSLAIFLSIWKKNNIVCRFSIVTAQILVILFLLEATFFLTENTQSTISLNSDQIWKNTGLTVVSPSELNRGE